MKIAYASDLHRESNMGDLPMPTNIDVLVLCGDVTNGAEKTIKITTEIQEMVSCPVVFVLGNHEFYDGVPIQDTIKAVRGAFQYNPNIHFLENNTVDINGVRFIGGTLWTDFKAYHGDMQTVALFVATKLNDYKMINVNSSKGIVPLSNIFWLQKHEFTRKFIEHAVEKSELPTVVVTHYAGHPALNGEAPFKQTPLKGGFVSDIQEIRPDVWLSGHTHEQMYFEEEGTLFATNCYGYDAFEPHLTENFTWKYVDKV